MDVEAALKVAVARLGIAELRDKQREAIESFVSGKDAVLRRPTYWVWKIFMLPDLAYSI